MRSTIRRTIRVLLLGLVPALATALATVGLAQSPAPATWEGVLLLRNGQVLSGKITPNGNRYEIAVPHGHISVQTTEIEFCANHIEELYQMQLAKLAPGIARDHLELAKWCHQVGLLRQAAEQLALAQSIEPTHPIIPVLRRALEISFRPPPPMPEKSPTTPTAPKKSSTTSLPSEKPPENLSSADLDRMVRGMPPGVVKSFTRKVQPILINRCAMVACHGPGSSTPLSLSRPSPRLAPSRRMTQRNLHAVLAWVDRQNPAVSPLLTAPIQAHGSSSTAVFSYQNATQYQTVVDWVHRLAQPAEPSQAVSLASGTTSQDSSADTVPAVYVAPSDAGQSLDPTGESNPELPASALSPNVSGSEPRPTNDSTFVPKDPFDPAIFNRRYVD